MPPKSTGKEKGVDKEEVLQAVVIAESFNQRFAPLTANKPRCLLPMCNAPLLDWTFESLSVAGVHEVFVMCQSHFESIEQAIQKSKWSQSASPLKIHAMKLPTSTQSFGDALRFVDSQSIITNDFVLVSGDMVCNVKIDEMVKAHKARRKLDHEVIMTVLVKEAAVGHRTRPKGETAIFTLDAESRQLLHYEGVPAVPKVSNATISRALLKEAELDIRYDLIDCGIDVCSVDVPIIFSDNFHENDLRRDFVTDVLTSEILGKKIYCHFADDGYAARVRDSMTYAAVSRDILGRWCFPLVPDDNHPGGHQYEHLPGNRYLAKDKVVLSRNCKIGNNTLIGPGSRLNDTARVEGSVLGENCTIEGGAMIRNSYLWNNVHIGAGCIIKESILGAGVILETGTVVERGCLIGEGVVVKAHSRVIEFSRIAKRNGDQGLGDGDGGYLLDDATQQEEDPDSDEDADPFESAANLRYLRLGGIGKEESESETEADDSGSEGETNVHPAFDPMELDRDPWCSLKWQDEFGREAYQTLKRGVDEHLDVDNVALELTTLRMASNADPGRLKVMVVAFMLEQIKIVEGNVAGQKKAAMDVVERWGELVASICRGEMIQALWRLQQLCSLSAYQSVFGAVVSACYMEEVINEDTIKKWHALPESKGAEGSNMNKLWKIGQSMLAALAQDSDDEESEEEEDEDESEEEASADENPAPKAKSGNPPTGAKAPPPKSEEEEDDDEDDDDEDDEEEEE
ncbi:hypothetical protein FRC18_012332 [Serendipita sp. 400]|nr:hypothetical protein FRC18_012332 [Serendipita sp. 400]